MSCKVFQTIMLDKNVATDSLINVGVAYLIIIDSTH